MNHFTPFLPAAAISRGNPRPKSSSRDLETRLLEATRTRQAPQRAKAVDLLIGIQAERMRAIEFTVLFVIVFWLGFAIALRIP
ncbi:hypothetical protein [Rhizobium lentis]|nr:hypothetical protein [Rhizobium lentis]MBB4574426.1 hypothetical protein [Rhizobium lentis]MBB5550352.1 hypothetical protein [Rhizobium lentis]